MSGIVRTIIGFLAGGLAAYILGTILNAQFVMNAHGVPIGLGDRLSMTAFDMSSMLLYLGIIIFGFAIAFPIAVLIKRFAPGLAAIAYPVAGAVAIGTALGLMYIQFQTVPISGARSGLGFIAQMFAGAFGGWVFARIVQGTTKSAN